ncbi:hypothetical protein GPJ56_005754 [Histomonas meleagridis]|uniref:uncharacterized protein n=1 Tax=Histomonas meleagridis TaxID=135588 RepID=UPI0035596704|nr:hypothetical protein GPJ56_005754 [Histomonas meleagridis]KAH0796154.1 hypothetical protein GO595_010047 [Histomonas meleagridis]
MRSVESSQKIVDIDLLNQIDQTFRAIPEVDNILYPIQELSRLIESAGVPIDDMLGANDGLNILLIGLCEFTEICYFTLRVFLVLISTHSNSVFPFIAENVERFIPLIRSPDLQKFVITILMLTIDAIPDMTQYVVIERNLIVKISELANEIGAPKYIQILLTLIIELLRRIDLSQIPPELIVVIQDKLRPLILKKFSFSEEQNSLFTKEIIIPLLRLYDMYLFYWPEECDSFFTNDILNEVEYLVFHPFQFDRNVYKEVLRVLNRMLLVMKDNFFDPKSIIEYLCDHRNELKSVKLEILFLLSNFSFFPNFSEIFFELNTIPSLYIESSSYSLSEKENAFIIILNLLANFPKEVKEMFEDKFKDYLDDAFDLLQAAKDSTFTYFFIKTFRELYDNDNAIVNIIDQEAAVESLQSLLEKDEKPETIEAAQEMLSFVFGC